MKDIEILMVILLVKKVVYRLEIQVIQGSKISLHRGHPIDWRTDLYSISFRINGGRGRGIKVSSYSTSPDEYGPRTPEAIFKRVGSYFILPVIDQFVHFFYEDVAKSILVSGGMGASLAVLTSIAHMTNVADNFDGEEDTMNKWELEYYRRHRKFLPPLMMFIPEGFVVSVTALEKIIGGHASLEANLIQLADLLATNSDTQIRGLCYLISYQIRDMKIDEQVQAAISQAYHSLRSIYAKGGKLPMAVRSSSIGEDREDIMSAGGGGNESYFGLRTEGEVLSAIKKCWASLYSYRSVQYRKRNLQPIRTGVAVVVHRMIACDVSGVMYTQHPVTGNPKQVLISSNYGLAETVVTREVDPDNYIVQRSYGDNHLKIVSRKIGTKKVKLQMGQSGRVERVAVGVGRKLSLQDGVVVRLAEIGVILEKMFSSPKEIEWGVKGVSWAFFRDSNWKY